MGNLLVHNTWVLAIFIRQNSKCGTAEVSCPLRNYRHKYLLISNQHGDIHIAVTILDIGCTPKDFHRYSLKTESQKEIFLSSQLLSISFYKSMAYDNIKHVSCHHKPFSLCNDVTQSTTNR